MKRALTAREWVLLGLLAVLATASCYVMLFYQPVTERRDHARDEMKQIQEELDAAQLRAGEKVRMERELEELFAREIEPVSLAQYDNLQPVMLELNTILAAANDYSLSFSSVDTEGMLVRRSISLSFTAGSYAAAKDILRQLRDSAYRCMLDTVNLAVSQPPAGSGVSVNGTIVFFEYQ